MLPYEKMYSWLNEPSLPEVVIIDPYDTSKVTNKRILAMLSELKLLGVIYAPISDNRSMVTSDTTVRLITPMVDKDTQVVMGVDYHVTGNFFELTFVSNSAFNVVGLRVGSLNEVKQFIEGKRTVKFKEPPF